MAIPIDSVGSTNAEVEKPKVEPPPPPPPPPPDPDAGRTSKVGMQNFGADMVRFQLTGGGWPQMPTMPQQPTLPQEPPPATDTPKTFTADDQVPEYPYTETGDIGPDASPEESADFIRNLEYSLGDTRTTQAQFFVQSLEDHKGDPQWTQGFFRSLGSEATAELIGHSVTPTANQYLSEEEINQRISVLRDGISGLAENPDLFSQADMDKLVGQMADEGFNPLVASEIFSKMSYEDEAVKNMFVKAATKQALDPETDGRRANELAAAATNVLSSTSPDKEALELRRLQQAGQLTPLIQKAMAGPHEYPTLNSLAELGGGLGGPVTYEPYANVSGLLLNISVSDMRDPFMGPAPLTSAEYSAVRTEMFNAATQALTDGKIDDSYKDDRMFLDALGSIFTKDFDAIVESGVGTNGAGFDILRFQPGMEKFFQRVVFTSDPTPTSQAVTNFLAGRMTEFGQALTDTSPDAEARFREKYGYSRMDGAAIAGGLLGMVTNGLKASKDELKANAEAQAGAIKFVVDMAFGFIPGVGGKITEGLEKGIAKTIIEKTLGPVQDAVLDNIKEGLIDEAKQLLLDQYENKDPEEAALGLFNALNQTIPNGDEQGEQNFRAEFTSSYTVVINSPNRIAK